MSEREVEFTIRWVEKYDIEQVMEAERLWNTVEMADQDFGLVTLLNPWTMSREAFMDMLSSQGTYTAVVTVPVEDSECPEEDTDWVVGVFTWEKEVNGWSLLWFAICPFAPIEEITNIILDELKQRADRSVSRKRVTFYLRDRDEARIRGLLPLFKLAGFSVKLAPNYFEGLIDGWKCEYESQVIREGGGAVSV